MAREVLPRPNLQTVRGATVLRSRKLKIAVLAGALVLKCAASEAETYPLPPAGDDVIGVIRKLVTREQDTLLDIGRRFGLGYGEITAANPGVDPWLPGEGTHVVVPTQFILPPGPRRGLVLNISQLRLFYFPIAKPGQAARVMTFAIGIGTDYARTPLGQTRIIRKAADPIWRPSQDIREEHAAEGHWLEAEVKAGPLNPLGKYALYLAMPGSYLIHGTNKPWGVGMRVSHGCIRMYPEGIESLYSQVPVGTAVRIIDEPYLFGWRARQPYLQVFPRAETAQATTLTPAVKTILERLPYTHAPDWDRIMTALSEQRGLPMPIALGTPALSDLLETAPEVVETAPALPDENSEKAP
ncbi:MAG: L,D-transpeptidase family protein [Betaproteobacteria bacterium]